MGVLLGLAILSVTVWISLLCFRGQFWQADRQLEAQETKKDETGTLPIVCAVIPARNEAQLLPVTLRSLLTQDYPNVKIILVDDHSTDGTTQVAKATAEELGSQQLQVIHAKPLPLGWTGKLWAIEQGIQAAQIAPEYILLTDADIEHDCANLRRLVTKAQAENLDLVSVMVRLRCESFWEKLLLPAFVFFFQKLYPFRWVNDRSKTTAAAAGGCILIRQTALEQIGGLQVVRQALIDDCALAYAVKSTSPSSRGIWLGLSDLTRSLRPYPSLKTIWDMVARTAFTQLHYSPLLLFGTVVGMILIYMVAPVATVLGVVTGNWAIATTGFIGWLLMSVAYYPTIDFYKCSPWFAICLPAIALLYTLMTIDSALRHWQGKGGAWKGRIYSHSIAGK